jgi:dsDNA-specific endonuclease/ATPase MutS2
LITRFFAAAIFVFLIMNIPLAILSAALRRAKERADALAAKLELSERAREKAEADAAAVEGLRQRLHTSENALSDKIAQQIEREKAIIARLDTQNRRFVSKFFPLSIFVLILIWFAEC